MRETLADVYEKQYDHFLRGAAEILLWDWRAAAEIAGQAKAILTARREKIEADAARYDKPEYHDGVLLGAVGWAYTRPAVDRARALGYRSPEWAERAELLERIETLPAMLREPMRLWLDGESIPESLGWSVRQGLTLLGRRAAA